MAVELRGVAVRDPLGQAAAIPFGRGGLSHELVPVVRIVAQDPPIAHHERHACRVQPIFKQLECPSEVALPAVGVPGQEEVKSPGTRLDEHLRHRR